MPHALPSTQIKTHLHLSPFKMLALAMSAHKTLSTVALPRLRGPPARSAQTCTYCSHIWSTILRGRPHPHWATDSQVWPPQRPRCRRSHQVIILLLDVLGLQAHVEVELVIHIIVVAIGIVTSSGSRGSTGCTFPALWLHHASLSSHSAMLALTDARSQAHFLLLPVSELAFARHGKTAGPCHNWQRIKPRGPRCTSTDIVPFSANPISDDGRPSYPEIDEGCSDH